MNRAFINGAENISPGFNCHVYLFRPGDTNLIRFMEVSDDLGGNRDASWENAWSLVPR